MTTSLQDQINFYVEFKERYFEIIRDFGFSYQQDCEARNYLFRLLNQKGEKWDSESILRSFSDLFQEKKIVLIYGCGPSLEITVDYLLRECGKELFRKCINLAADGASILLREREIPVEAIFSDLDGITKVEFNYPEFFIIHAHGDNIGKMSHFKEEILMFPNIIGTTQVEPIDTILNPGGFTDGDRILYFIRALLQPHNTIYFIGMDFNEIIGRYSKPNLTENHQGTPMKLKKLEYAIKLIECLIEKMSNEIFFLNSKIASNRFKYLTIKEFAEHLKK